MIRLSLVFTTHYVNIVSKSKKHYKQEYISKIFISKNILLSKIIFIAIFISKSKIYKINLAFFHPILGISPLHILSGSDKRRWGKFEVKYVRGGGATEVRGMITVDRLLRGHEHTQILSPHI